MAYKIIDNCSIYEQVEFTVIVIRSLRLSPRPFAVGQQKEEACHRDTTNVGTHTTTGAHPSPRIPRTLQIQRLLASLF